MKEVGRYDTNKRRKNVKKTLKVNKTLSQPVCLRTLSGLFGIAPD